MAKIFLGNIRGPKGADGEKGEPGKNGKDGYTPVKGKDYFTEADIAEIVARVVNALSLDFVLNDYGITSIVGAFTEQENEYGTTVII